MSSRAKLIGRLIFWPLFLWAMLLIAQNPTYVRYRATDWWRLLSYEAPSQIQELASEATLTDSARSTFYASLPELHGKSTFSTHCKFPEQSFVIGCYDGSRIYVLDIDLPELEPAEPVTAAHEMLHAAWARLTEDEQGQIGRLLNEEYRRSTNQHLIDLVQRYRDANNNDPEVITNELHSILGTEIRDLSPELENYYARYFKDRQAVVALYESYEAVFAAVEAELTGLKEQIEALYIEIQAMGQDLEEQKQAIDANDARLKQLKASGDTAGYNALVNEQNARIRRYNRQVATFNAQIEQYQTLAAQYQDRALRQNSLSDAFNTKPEIEQ